MNRIVDASRSEARIRCGSVTVMVLVVMLVVGLMVLQSSQLLIAFYQGDRLQRQVEQNRELIELGIAKAQMSLAQSQEYSGEVFSVPVWERTELASESTPERRGRIQIEVLSSPNARASIFRVTAAYPAGEPGETVSRWESR